MAPRGCCFRRIPCRAATPGSLAALELECTVRGLELPVHVHRGDVRLECGVRRETCAECVLQVERVGGGEHFGTLAVDLRCCPDEARHDALRGGRGTNPCARHPFQRRFDRCVPARRIPQTHRHREYRHLLRADRHAEDKIVVRSERLRGPERHDVHVRHPPSPLGGAGWLSRVTVAMY